jgi:hypothetical protein
MDAEETRRMAKRMGLDKPDERLLQEIADALKSADGLAGRLPRDLRWTEEPAHVFRPATGKGARP